MQGALELIRKLARLADGDDRHARRRDVAEGRRAWRTLRHDGDQGRARGARRGATRKVVLVPESAHGTNPATAALIGFSVRVGAGARRRHGCRVEAVREALGPDVAAIMLTNPNTCGLFEREIVEIAEAVHEAGAYFYCDGANFNAIVGKARPGDLGVDAMHINLHKTFSTPHGGGGPGAGPVVLSERLAPFAPVPFRCERDGGGSTWSNMREGSRRSAASPPSTARWACSCARSPSCCRTARTACGRRREDAVLTANYVRAVCSTIS